VWIQSLHSSNPAQLKFSINGNSLPGNIAASPATCQWNSFFVTWNSGNNTSVTIAIRNNNTVAQGNDFAIDDIFFGPVQIKQDSIRVSITPPPIIRAGNDTTICVGRSVQLNATGGAMYSWTPTTGLSDPNIADPIAAPSSSIQYIVSGYNIPGCNAKDTINVFVLPPPIFSVNPAQQSICDNKQFSVSANGADSYQWYSNITGNLGNTSSINLTATQNDTLFVIMNNNTCQVSDTLNSVVTVKANPLVILSKSNDITCITPQAKLNASGGINYVWSPANSVSNPTINDPFVFPPIDTWYKVTVTNSDGCSTQDSIIVLADFSIGKGNFYVPSAFTPNNDGKNDCFGVRYWGTVQTFEFWIYNRWGEVVFYTKNLQDCWNGTFKGHPQSAGVYVYQIKANSLCSAVPVYRKGLVTLIR
jgi:gliding motility-associated-like protein